ncbi:unnamed protein product, partial [Polarella glacialis]
ATTASCNGPAQQQHEAQKIAAVDEPESPSLALRHDVHFSGCACDEVLLTPEELMSLLRRAWRVLPQHLPSFRPADEPQSLAPAVDPADFDFGSEDIGTRLPGFDEVPPIAGVVRWQPECPDASPLRAFGEERPWQEEDHSKAAAMGIVPRCRAVSTSTQVLAGGMADSRVAESAAQPVQPRPPLPQHPAPQPAAVQTRPPPPQRPAPQPTAFGAETSDDLCSSRLKGYVAMVE